jgi:dihydrodipicolinate synthase/N-acetylneuraminate lyase
MPTLSESLTRARPARHAHGISAVLLPYEPSGGIDWEAFEKHLLRTRAAELDIAVNMDTGFGDLLTEAERAQVLDVTRRLLGDATFYAGAFGGTGDGDPDSCAPALRAIEARGAVPVIVQSRAMHRLRPVEKAEFYHRICSHVTRALAFELGAVFAGHGEIWDDETFARIIDIPKITGAKHSSLDRSVEFRRLAARERLRPDFRIYTGNDLAIDMVLYGSDYLLGLSTFAPQAFATRDRALTRDDVAFLDRNDALQHLGNVGFRAPVPAYKHSAAMYLHITGDLDGDAIHPRAPRRPASDRILLFDCAMRLGALKDPEATYADRVQPYL